MTIPKQSHPIAGNLLVDVEWLRWLRNLETAVTTGNAAAAAALVATPPAWGNITGTLSDQTDLQTVLDTKVDTATNGLSLSLTDVKLGGTLDEVTNIDIGHFAYNWNFSTTDAGVTNVGQEFLQNNTAIDPGFIEKGIYGSSTKPGGDGTYWFMDAFSSNDGNAGGGFDYSYGEVTGTVTVDNNVQLRGFGTWMAQEYTDSANPGNNHTAKILLVANASSATATVTGTLTADNLSGTNTGDQVGVTAGDAGVGSWVLYNGTTQAAGKWDGGITAPAHTTRLNYDGELHATKFYGDGSALTGITAGTDEATVMAHIAYGV